MVKLHSRKPDIENLYKVLRREKPDRPTFFELFLNEDLYTMLTGREIPVNEGWQGAEYCKLVIDAYAAAGYDYAWARGSRFTFPTSRHKKEGKSSFSLNDGACITDWASFESYEWPQPENLDYSMLETVKNHLPEGMKLAIYGPGGVLENVIQLAGYENLCILIFEEPELVKALFDNVGSRMLKHYEIAASFDSVGLVASTDDWGFKTQTFLSCDHMREYVFPWHKKIADAAHSFNKPAVLHSCGHLTSVMDDVIDTIGFDGKHSYEDTITPVEEAWDKWHNRIAILGGIDVDFLVRKSEKEIADRVHKMLDRANGSWAVGSGNTIPDYVPQEKYFAMIKAALDWKN